MSDMIQARRLLVEVQGELIAILTRVDIEVRAITAKIDEARLLMVRRSPQKRVEAAPIVITPLTKSRIRWLRANTDMTLHQIAEATHVPNIGRVSEVLREGENGPDHEPPQGPTSPT